MWQAPGLQLLVPSTGTVGSVQLPFSFWKKKTFDILFKIMMQDYGRPFSWPLCRRLYLKGWMAAIV